MFYKPVKKNNEFRVNVLQGTTGSGKTLVYFNLVKDKIKQNKQAIILLPEIGLTGEFEKKIHRFFLALNQLSGILVLHQKIKRKYGMV